MSQAGKLTPLGINALSGLYAEREFSINATSLALQGIWNPGGYIQGNITKFSFLNNLVQATNNFYSLAAAGRVSPTVYRKLLSMGEFTCSALANTKPQTFVPTYSGYGSWQGNTKRSSGYPSKGYPVDGSYSYIKSSYGNYAYITGWPGRNSWQKPDDGYKAAFIPPSTYNTITDYDEYFKDGFIGCVARQAYHELSVGEFTQYNNIVDYFQQTDSWRQQKNGEISSLVNSKTFQTGNFSNINDTTTNNLSGVSKSFRLWGNDLVNSGRAISLPMIYKFGTPSVLLLTLQANRVATDAVKMAMILSGMTTDEISNAFDNEYFPKPAEEKKIYEAFKLIKGDDLTSIQSGVLMGINCTTQGIETLADLLDPRKLFPNSYRSLTVPQYRTDTPTSKTYYFIYENSGVNASVANLPGVKTQYEELVQFLPVELSIACAAFSVSMQQVKNIMQSDIEKLSLAVRDLELVNKGLPLIDTINGVPVDIGGVDSVLKTQSLGSGNNGTYRQCDFFGAASGYLYETWYRLVDDLMKQLPANTLNTIYTSMLTLSLTPIPVPPEPEPDFDGPLTDLINQANAEILRLKNSYPGICNKINYYWNQIGTQLSIEQRSWPFVIETPVSSENGENTTNPSQFLSFIQSVEQYAQDNSPGESADTLERISDLAVIGGQSLVAMMREARNAKRLGWMGGPPNNDVSDEIDACSASAALTIDDKGSISSVTLINRAVGYIPAKPPAVRIYPYGYGGVLSPVIAEDGSISDMTIVNSGQGYPYTPQVEIGSPPQCLPATPVLDTSLNPGFNVNPNTPNGFNSFGDEFTVIQQTLPPPDSASDTVDEAIESVTRNNCECWNI